jgi:hypothetical protein
MTNFIYIAFLFLLIITIVEWLLTSRLFNVKINWKVHLLFMLSNFLIFTIILNEFSSYMIMPFYLNIFLWSEVIFWYIIIILLIWVKIYFFRKLTHINSVKILLFSIWMSVFLTISFNALLWYYIYSNPCFLCK